MIIEMEVRKMERKKRNNATEISVFIKYIPPFGRIRIVDPSTDGEGMPVKLFGILMDKLAEAEKEYNNILIKK